MVDKIGKVGGAFCCFLTKHSLFTSSIPDLSPSSF